MQNILISLARLTVLAFSAWLLSACSVSGNILDMTTRISTIQAQQSTGFTPGNTIQTASGGYKVQSSLGDSVATLSNSTTSGYTVYSNVEGNRDSQ